MATKPHQVILPKKLARTSNPVSGALFNTTSTDSAITDNALTGAANQSINALRAVDPITAIRSLVKYNGSFSKAVWSFVQLAMSGYTVTARDSLTHKFNQEATLAAKTVIASIGTLYDYTTGYGDKSSIDSLLETMLKEVVQAGACCAELVLSKDFLPEKVVTLPVTDISWYPKKSGGKSPKQRNRTGVGSSYINLDIPTFFFASAHQDAAVQGYTSPMEPGLNMLFIFYEFVEDVARTIRASGHSRTVIKLISDKILPSIPKTIRDDPAKLRAELESIRSTVADLVGTLKPEETLVHYDNAEVDKIASTSEKADYTKILDTFGTLLASSLKSMPSILGLSGTSASQNLATTEAMVYLHLCAGMQTPVEVVMSRLLTLAVRLVSSQDVYCTFKFNPIDLRPENELAAHRATQMQDDKWKLSAGFMSDEEFAHKWDLDVPVNKLSGTMFMDGGTQTVQPRDLQQNIQGGVRTLNEGTKQGPPSSSPARGGK